MAVAGIGNGMAALLRADRLSQRTRRALVAYLLLSPAIVYFTVFFFYPIGLEFLASLHTGQPLIGESRFAGFDNYMTAFQDARVRQSVIVTLAFAIGVTAASIAIGLGLAVLLNRPIPGHAAIRAIIFFPYIISFVIVALMWQAILDPYTGILNSILAELGLPTQSWLSETSTALPTLIAITVWKDVGYAMLIYLAALQSIPSDFYDAASIDGASPAQQFRHVTWPLLTPTTLFIAVVSTISQLQELAPAYLITKGGPADATRLFSLHVFEAAFFELNIGYASALSFLMFLLILAITFVQFRLLNREVSY
ncbi:sugar ABC transporter permease [Mesorhizobium sp. M00.F.Ca.ET.216.01.1.1]|uniref:carbohydrate ABC transporter permease n=1 Tax=Mesorhizobium sp. M00.F.Ca.ET.216.01.1.1 TaxID=2500528 RepID=UPI001FDF55B4|nr:sugar ABC transporter permease [Mesorhizobium sp. M00.F.Ca.ET.216.01.1.1]